MSEANESAIFSGTVLLVVDRDAVARFGHMFEHLCLAMQERDAKVLLLTDEPELAADLEDTPIGVYTVASLTSWTRWRFASTLQRLIPDPPDCVHLWGTPSLGGISRWTERFQIPLFIHVTADEELETILRRSLKPHERPIGLCHAIAESLPRLGRDNGLVPPGLPTTSETPTSPTRGRTIGILWAGNCDQHSGLPTLIEAVGRIPVDDMDLQVAVVGDGPELDDVWKRIRDQKVADRFSMIGGTRLWEQAIPGMDVCVVTARQNPLRLAPMLAMAHGKLVLTTDDQRAEWFVPQETCETFPAGDSAALASLLRRFRDGHPNLLAIARAARHHVIEHYPVRATAENLLRHYAGAPVT